MSRFVPTEVSVHQVPGADVIQAGAGVGLGSGGLGPKGMVLMPLQPNSLLLSFRGSEFLIL